MEDPTVCIHDSFPLPSLKPNTPERASKSEAAQQTHFINGGHIYEDESYTTSDNPCGGDQLRIPRGMLPGAWQVFGGVSAMVQPSRNSLLISLGTPRACQLPPLQRTVRAAQSLSLLRRRGPALHLHNTDGTDGSMLPHGDGQLGSVPPAVTVQGEHPGEGHKPGKEESRPPRWPTPT